jgi:hypothetical protein
MRRIGRLAVAAEVLENPLNRCWLFDARDHPQLPATAPADLDVDGKDTLEALRPSEGPENIPTSEIASKRVRVQSRAVNSSVYMHRCKRADHPSRGALVSQRDEAFQELRA